MQNRIKAERKRLGLTLMSLSNMTEIDNSLLSRYENHKTAVPDERKVIIARALDCSIERLFFDENLQKAS